MMLMCIVHDIITGSKKDAYIHIIYIYVKRLSSDGCVPYCEC